MNIAEILLTWRR